MKKNYQTLSTDLDQILTRLQDSTIDIDEAIKLFDEGQKLVKELEQYLKIAKNKINKLTVKNN